MRILKEMNGAPKSRYMYDRDEPKERELNGDAGPVVVVGVTPHRGGRESRPHGRRGPGDWIFEAGRYA